MGRELRRVVPNWEHPKERKYSEWTRSVDDVYKPLYDGAVYARRVAEYKQECAEWDAGKRYEDPEYSMLEFWDYYGPPPMQEDFSMPLAADDSRTWYQLYETVSEGTPVSPAFDTVDELARYLTDNGDFWYQKRIKAGKSDYNSDYDGWLKFLSGRGYAPSMVVSNGKVMTGVEAAIEGY